MTLERGNAFTPVASATMIWPWTTSLLGGAAGGTLFFLLNLGSGAIGAGLTAGIIFFSLIGGIGGVISRKSDRRGRRWAATYPFRYATAPALVGGAGYAIVSYATSILSAPIAGLFGAVFSGLFVAAAIWLVVGVIAMVVGNKNA
ncbi:hypothetical protein ACIBFB_25380 [Nocardiopsis sp. NPDC050513]|uniref:hypothetical protein n=1 Tax=Nocardiopsis sp. NPDC050513 TaxID=3364338 RepID=UPI00379497AA